MKARPNAEQIIIFHSLMIPDRMTMRRYIIISNEPISEIKQVKTLVKNLSLSQDPKTMKLMKMADRMKGKGTTDPGSGTHAVSDALI